MRTWFTVDTDDIRHLPRYQGHPTRSKRRYAEEASSLSLTFKSGWQAFLNWMHTHDGIVTIFVITDLLEGEEFPRLLEQALLAFPHRIYVGCHGHTHRSWSAWGEDTLGFGQMLEKATGLLHKYAKNAFVPFFRAPNGYVSPWMADVLATHGYIVDSSVNPSWLVKHKTAGYSWQEVSDAMRQAGLVERPWQTSFTLPVNGPALFRFPLSSFAKRAWRKAPQMLGVEDMHCIQDPQQTIITLYCHILDFARQKGAWTPPLRP